MNLEKIWNETEPKPWQVKEEFLLFMQFVLDNNIKTVLEIGTHKGGTASALLKLGCRVTSVDIVKQPEIEKLEEHISFEFLLRTEFSEAVEELKILHGIQLDYDLLFIDGDHSLQECMRDYEEYSPLVKERGWIAFHDSVDSALHAVQKCEVWKVINEIRPNKRIDFITDGNWGGITIIEK